MVQKASVFVLASIRESMVNQVTIPVKPDTRNRVREIKGFERSYDELLSEWAERIEQSGDVVQNE